MKIAQKWWKNHEKRQFSLISKRKAFLEMETNFQKQNVYAFTRKHERKWKKYNYLQKKLLTLLSPWLLRKIFIAYAKTFIEKWKVFFDGFLQQSLKLMMLTRWRNLLMVHKYHVYSKQKKNENFGERKKLFLFFFKCFCWQRI